LLCKIKCRDDFDVDNMTSPMPLQAILLTNDDIKGAISKNHELFYGKVQNDEQMQLLRMLLTAGFDDIITTNYSYELEAAARYKEELSDYQIKKSMRNTQNKNAEPKYMLHTYNEAVCENVVNRIWHIHGESRKPDSILLGHYWYGKLFSKILEELEVGRNKYQSLQKQGKEIKFDSWIDSFILSDLYILGFGFDFSEFDLWWLLNRRKRENAEKGKVYFFDPCIHLEREKEKRILLELLDVHIEDSLNFNFSKENELNDEYFRKFYTCATEEISNRIKN